jgi:uncharacterized membrane protein
MDTHTSRTPLLAAGTLLGLGLGGFVDGILFHQVLQWHHMLTGRGDFPATTVAGLELNTLADGVFHAAAWLLTALGLYVLARTVRQPRHVWSDAGFFGAMLFGWGVFNLVEGIIDHHLLGIHHVRDDVANPLPWDLAFLVFGVLLFFGGVALMRAGRRDVAADEVPRRADLDRAA